MCRCYGARGLDPVFHIVNIDLEPLGALRMHSRERLSDALVHTRPRHHETGAHTEKLIEATTCQEIRALMLSK